MNQFHPDRVYDLYYKVCCYWNAKTELYDSMIMTDYLYDAASIRYSKLRGFSAEYSRQMFLFSQHVLTCECEKPFDNALWNRINGNSYAASQWIKEYERMVSSGELDFIEEYKN